jgi:hypothetical protein
VKKLTLIVALFGMLLVGFSTAANAGFSLDFGFGIAPAPPPVVVLPPAYYPYGYPAPAPYYPAPRYYAPRYYAPPPVTFDFRFGDRGWRGRHPGHHWR